MQWKATDVDERVGAGLMGGHVNESSHLLKVGSTPWERVGLGGYQPGWVGLCRFLVDFEWIPYPGVGHRLLGWVGGWMRQANPLAGAGLFLWRCPCGTSVSENSNASCEHINSLFHQAYLKRKHAPKFAKVGFTRLFRKIRNVVWNQLSLHPVCLFQELIQVALPDSLTTLGPPGNWRLTPWHTLEDQGWSTDWAASEQFAYCELQFEPN